MRGCVRKSGPGDHRCKQQRKSEFHFQFPSKRSRRVLQCKRLVRDVQKVKEDKFKCSEDLFLLPRIESLAANRLFAPPRLRDLTRHRPPPSPTIATAALRNEGYGTSVDNGLSYRSCKLAAKKERRDWVKRDHKPTTAIETRAAFGAVATARPHLILIPPHTLTAAGQAAGS